MNHTAEFEQNARGDKSHEETWKVATGMAAVGLKLFRDPSFSKEVSGTVVECPRSILTPIIRHGNGGRKICEVISCPSLNRMR